MCGSLATCSMAGCHGAGHPPRQCTLENSALKSSSSYHSLIYEARRIRSGTRNGRRTCLLCWWIQQKKWKFKTCLDNNCFCFFRRRSAVWILRRGFGVDNHQGTEAEENLSGLRRPRHRLQLRRGLVRVVQGVLPQNGFQGEHRCF